MKFFANYYWNYKIGNQKQKYLYLLLEDLLCEINQHQIYNLQEIFYIFGQVSKVYDQQFDLLQSRLRIQTKQNFNIQYKLSSANNENQDSKLITLKDPNSKHSNSQSNSKNQLKNKIKAQIDVKCKKTQQHQPQKKQLQIIDQSNRDKGLVLPQQKISSNLPNDLKKIFSETLVSSPSFIYNILTYYILVLENVIRYETELINNPKFYTVYKKAAQNFIFNTKLESLIQNYFSEESRQKQFNQILNHQLKIIKILRKSVISELQSIDFHKILTYLINCRHLAQNLEQPSSLDVNTSPQKNNFIQQLLQNYLSLIQNLNQKDRKRDSLSRILQSQVQKEDKIIQLAVNNKNFINSLKQLYLKSQFQDDKSEKNEIKGQESKALKNKTIEIINRIFNRIDKWYIKSTEATNRSSKKQID